MALPSKHLILNYREQERSSFNDFGLEQIIRNGVKHALGEESTKIQKQGSQGAEFAEYHYG
jgi:hypothetical protein